MAYGHPQKSSLQVWGTPVRDEAELPATGATAPARITELTRRTLLDSFSLSRTWWAGRLDEVAFLNRVYDLSALPSTDRRYADAAGNIHQHRLNNNDWDDDWVFHDPRFELSRGPDEVLLRFLAEMLHPIVRNADEVDDLLTRTNNALRPDGYELAVVDSMSGHPIFAGRARESFHGDRPALALDERAPELLTDPKVLHEHLDRIGSAVAKDPAAAIASSKELLESLCKIILDRAGKTYTRNDDLPALYKQVSTLLAIRAESVPQSAKGSQSAAMILRTLTTTVQGLAELRNEFGLGHGRSGVSPALARHARLALNSAVTVTEFLLDTWQQRVDSGALLLVT